MPPSRTGQILRGGLLRLGAIVLGTALLVPMSTGLNAEPAFPFEGTWVRADRVCSVAAPHARNYSHREVVSTGDRCAFRRVEFSSGEWEIDEECRRPDRRRITERIRMLGPDAILVRRQVVRLKIPRGRRFVRCTIAGAPPAPAPALKSTPPIPMLKGPQPATPAPVH